MKIQSVMGAVPTAVQERSPVKLSDSVNSAMQSSTTKIKRTTENSATPLENFEQIRKNTAKAMEELKAVSATYNRRLEFSVNQDIDRLVVRVIDTTTNRLIKEIPSEEFQKLQSRIREAIGILFDETV